MKDKPGLSTRCVHSGELHDPQGSPHTPLYSTTTFAFGSTEELLDVVEGRKSGNLYTRYGLNPTIRSLEEKLASLEGAEAAFAFSSGMAAEAALFVAHGQKGIVCIGDAYGGTLELLERQLPVLGMRTHFTLGNEWDRLEAIFKESCETGILRNTHEPRPRNHRYPACSRAGPCARGPGGRRQYLWLARQPVTTRLGGGYRRPQRYQIPGRAQRYHGGDADGPKTAH